MESKKSKMAKFTAATATRIVSDNGAMCMNFEAGQTRPVHEDLWTAAIRNGLIPDNPVELAEPQVEGQVIPDGPEDKRSKGEIIHDALVDACKQLVARGNSNDFTQHGNPRVAALKKLVDFHFNGAQARRAFEQAMFEVDNDGDESTECTEPSSSTAE